MLSVEDCGYCTSFELSVWGERDPVIFWRYCSYHLPDPTPQELMSELDDYYSEIGRNDG